MTSHKIREYIEQVYEGCQVHEFVVAETAQENIPPSIDKDVTRFLNLLLRCRQPRRVLEIGTSNGYSIVSMAQIVQRYGGRITTMKDDEPAARQARQNFERAGVEGVIEQVQGDVIKILPALHEEFDFILLDVDKDLYPLLLSECIRLLSKDGFLAAADTLFPVIELDEERQCLVEPVAIFNQMIAAHPQLQSTILPIGDGMTLAVKKSNQTQASIII